MPTGTRQVNGACGGSRRADVAIVGAGAAGLAAAVFAARRMPGRSILLLDGGPRPGAKLLLAGGGRCNLTHRTVTPADYHSTRPGAVRRVLGALSVDETIAFFRGLGVTLHEEEGGKLFPDSQRAGTVLDALLAEVRRRGVALLTRHRVGRIDRGEAGFRLRAGAVEVAADCVVLATGGLSYPQTGSDGSGYALARSLGHAIVEPTPALVPLVLAGDFHKEVQGITQEVELAVRVAGRRPTRLRGPLQWTHFGVSGPVILDASRHWHRARLEGRDVALAVGFLPGEDFAAAEGRLVEAARRHPRVLLPNALSELLPERFARAWLARLGVAARVPLAHLSRDDRRRVAGALVDWPLPVSGSRGFAQAEVTAGGVDLGEVEPGTLGSRRCPGLFLAGEVLDVDGRLGGFNLQWAWSSAAAAAGGVARWFEAPRGGPYTRLAP